MKSVPIILLSGGKGSRVGISKGLVPFGKKLWIQSQVELLLALECISEVIVVLGFESEAYLAQCQDLFSHPRVRVVLNPHPEQGPFSSLQHGLMSLHESNEHVFILPVDTPVPSQHTWKKLMSLSHTSVVQPRFDGRGGHPVLLSRGFIETLKQLDIDDSHARLDTQIRLLPASQVRAVDVGDHRVTDNLNLPQDWARLSGRDDAVVASEAVVLTLTEVGVGSVMHALHIPFTGQALSLNQIFLMAYGTYQRRRESQAWKFPIHVSTIASLLKTLSPAGKKLTPMLAIAVQGWLFGIGVGLTGTGRLGIAVGAFLSSIWAFLQPLVLLVLMFGWVLAEMIQTIIKQIPFINNFTQNQWWWIISIVIGLKALLAITLSIVGTYVPRDVYLSYQQRLTVFSTHHAKKKNGLQSRNVFLAAARDLFNPLFVISFALTLGFLIFARTELSSMVVTVLRPLVVGYLLFLSVRTIPWSRLSQASPWLRQWISTLSAARRKLRLEGE